MPPSYLNETRFGIRYPAPGAALPDYETYLQSLAGDVGVLLQGYPPRVTVLPTVGPSGSGPLLDGQRCFLVADAANGVMWQLRYNASSSSARKWEFIGGPPLYAEVQTSETTTSITYADLTTAGPALTIPVLAAGGDFDVEIGTFFTSSDGFAGSMSYAVGGGGASDLDAVFCQVASVIGGATGSRKRRKTSLAGSTALTAKYRTDGVGTHATFAYRWMAIVPVRVG